MTKPTYLLEFYAEDDVTLLFDVSTDPAHARPYLKVPDGFSEQEIDFAKGAASIGQVNARIVDRRITATDQDTGYITSQLADADGYSQLNGHRAVLYENRGSGNELVLDGVVRQVTLLETLVTYEVELRDIRERERKQRAFEHTDTPTIFPRGVLDGYGRGPEGQWLVPPATDSPLAASYQSSGANTGRFNFAGLWTEGSVIPDELVVTDKQRAALESVKQNPDISTLIFHLIYDRFTVLWRDAAAGGAFTELTKIVHQSAYSGIFPAGAPLRTYGTREGRVGGSDGDRAEGLLTLSVDNFLSGATLPTDGQAVEVIVRYDGPVDEDWPYHLEGLTVGEFLRNLYRGDYSTDEEGNTVDPRIRYDEAALLALTTPVRGRIRKPWEDVRKEAEKHAYPVAGAAPALDASGQISPPTYELPDSGVTLVTLDESNCQAEAGWSHGVQDAVNVVQVVYQRDYRLTAEDDPNGTRSAGDGIASREITVEHRVAESIALLGEQELKVESDLLRAIGSRDGAPITGDVGDETGAQVAERITRMATDRFALGGQYFNRIANRNEALVEALKVGSWCLEATSWTPEYSTGTRGANRLAQVLGRRNLDANWCQLSLIDAGPDNVPLGQPTLGTVTASDEGIVSVPVSAVPTGGEARVDFAVVASGAAEPAEGSELWTFLGRTDAVGTLESPPLPADSRVWIRSRGEGQGRRPSAWTTGVSVSLAATPRVRDVRITIATDGTPTVHWTPNASAAGVRLHYEVHDPATDPTLPNTVDVDATAGSHELTGETVETTEAFSVDVEPFDGWTGSAVSGTAGPKVSASRGRSTGFDQVPAAPEFVNEWAAPMFWRFKVQAQAGSSGDDPAEYRYEVVDEDGNTITALTAWTALTETSPGSGIWESGLIRVNRDGTRSRIIRAQVRDTAGRESAFARHVLVSVRAYIGDLLGGHIGSWERDEVDIIGGDTRDDTGRSVRAPPGGVMDDAGLEQILDTEGRRLRNSALANDVTAETSGRLIDTVDDEAHDARRYGPGMGAQDPLEVSTQEGETTDDSGEPIVTRPGGFYDRAGLVRAITPDGEADQLAYQSGVLVGDREPQEAGANVTETRTADDVQTGGARAVAEHGADVTGNNQADDVAVGGVRNVQESGANNTESRTADDVQVGGGRNVAEAGADATANNTAADTSAVDGEPAANVHDGSDRARAVVDASGKVVQSDVLIDDGAAVRTPTRGYETGAGLEDGDAVTFGQAYNNVPLVVLQGGKTFSVDGGLDHTVDQAREVQAANLDAAGFDLRAKIVNRGATTARDEDFAAGTITATGTGNAKEANLANAPSSGDKYDVRWDVTIDATGTPIDCRLTLAIETNAQDGGGWIERATVPYFVAAGLSNTLTDEVRQIVVSDLDADDDVRIYAKSFSGGGTFSIDPNDVQYTTSVDTEVSATESNASGPPPYPVSYQALGVA